MGKHDRKVVLVTGSSRGIGKAIALKLAEEGADVIVHYHNRGSEAEEVSQQIQNMGRNSFTLQADLKENDQVQYLFDEIEKKFGRLDIYVANAASTAFKTLDDTKPHNVDITFQIVITSLVTGIQRASKLMSNGGSIITISGVDGSNFLPKHGILGAAKKALETITMYAACEYAERGINVNSVSPGAIDTDSARFYAKEEAEKLFQYWSKHTPKRRIGTPEDIAKVVSFLASTDAEWICGQTIKVDGGLSLVSPISFQPEAGNQ